MTDAQKYMQVCVDGGEVYDFALDEWRLLQRQATSGSEWLEATDIYGAFCRIRERRITSTRETTPEIEAEFRKRHRDDTDEDDRGGWP